MAKHYHPYHLVEPSPYPYMGSFAALGLTTGAVMYFHSYNFGGELIFISLAALVLVAYHWWRDVVREATFQGHHTLVVQRGLKYGMLLFIVSEAMLFFSFFWAYFHSALAPEIQVGGVWPPVGIQSINAFDVPLLNTAILLSSGATVTWAHHAMIAGNRKEAIRGLTLTVILGVIFTGLQAMEYYEAPFTIADSVYGSIFFVATGFHGLHVIIGTLFLLVMLIRLIRHHFTKFHHTGFEAAAWYWHFVDVVWLFLYVFVYWWGG